MADDGLQYATDMTDLTTKSNRKMIFVGTYSQLTNLTPTYPGQIVFATSTGGSFIINNFYKRNAGNTAWNIGKKVESDEQSQTQYPNADNSQAGAGVRLYGHFTLPTTERFYIITALEWLNGAVVTGTIVGGVEIENANPPTLDATPLLGVTQEILQHGIYALQRADMLSCRPIPGGTHVGAWISNPTAGQFLIDLAAGTYKNYKIVTYTPSPLTHNNTVFTVNDLAFYFRIYYRGYLQT